MPISPKRKEEIEALKKRFPQIGNQNQKINFPKINNLKQIRLPGSQHRG